MAAINPAAINRLARTHIRLWIAILAAVIAYALLPGGWPAVSRVLVSWNCGVIVFLSLVWRWMLYLKPERMRARFEEEDETAGVILLLVTLSALLSLLAIIALLTHVKELQGSARAAQVALAAVTIISSWTLVPTMFTLHYADYYYSSPPDRRPLTFPQTQLPEFWDFIYFSFTIAVACQTADIDTNTLAIRKIVTGHAIVSFIFNASILGFAINVSAGLVGAS